MEPMKPMEGMKPMKPMEPMPPVGKERWWPEPLGDRPNSEGGQNDMHYAYFADKNRLAVEAGGSVTVYDTKGYQVSGVRQEQSGGSKKLVFTGGGQTLDLDQLSKVSE